ncbi:MAG: DUF72 domain-containing protein [Candidatus Omnitrophota bacterium]
MARLWVGTSGWNYAHWANGVFYPQGLKSAEWLKYYAKFFNAVELNVTFYRQVQKKTFEHWRRVTPRNFCFVVKGSRFITHIKRLKDVKGSLEMFFDSVGALKAKCGAVLWQLPPGFKKDSHRLEGFLKLLQKKKIPQVFEFRHATWFQEDVVALLKSYRACLCIAHSDRFPCEKMVTANFLYLRFHGPGGLYGSRYTSAQLKSWVRFAREFKKKNIFVFFNNDACGHAVENALAFEKLMRPQLME